MKEIKTKGKFRKSKAYGLVGCLALFSIMITNPVINVKAEEFNRTDSGQVDNSNTEVNKLIPSEEIKSVPNGERNFYSTVAFTTEAGLGSGTLISPDTIVTVAHNFVHLNEKTNPISVDNNVNKNGDIHIATLPNGKQVKFSNDDVHFWNREGFVNGYKNDLAVIKLKKTFDSQPAELIDFAKKLSNNDKIHVFGFPKGKLQPILNGTVENVENYGANIYGVSYQGSAPGMSGGGLYDSEGKLIGVNQNGVEGLRSGGITFSKEQLDWINSIVRGENAKPVYLEENKQSDEKDSNNFELKNSEETNTLHDWIKDKITKLDFSKNTKDEFYGLVSEDGKTYGDVRKIVTDWNSAKIPEGTYSIKKLTIVDVSDEERKAKVTVEENTLSFEDGILGYGDISENPLIKTDKIVDKSNNKSIQPMFYSTESTTGKNLETPVFYNLEEFSLIENEKNKLSNPIYYDTKVFYKGDYEIPYGDRNLKISYFFNRKHEIGTKTKVEFVGDKIKVRTRKLVLKDKIVDEHNDIQKFDIIENNYQLDDEPRKIVKETPNMVIDDDPGILSAIPEGHESNNEIKQLKSKRTGYVFKVKSYEEDGTTSYRYFRTWTTLTNDGRYATTIPYDDSETESKLRDDLKTIEYVNDDTLEYSKIKQGAGFAYERAKNVTYLRWNVSEPTPNSNNTYVETYTPVLEDDTGIAGAFQEYPDTPPALLNIIYKNYLIGTKPELNKEMVEIRKTKYIANENLDTSEKIIQEGKDKFKVSKTIYTLIKNTSPREDVEGLFENNSIEAKEVTANYPNIPSLTNGGVTKETTIIYEEAEDRIIEKKVNKPRTEINLIPKSIKYIKDDTRDKSLPNEEVEGKDGSKSITITETVNEHTGEITENRGEPVIVNPTDTIVKVAAKTKVELIKKDGKVIERTTTYDVNRENGNITETVIERIISDNNSEKPPVLEIPEYTDPIGTIPLNVNPNGEQTGEENYLQPPTVEIETLKNIPDDVEKTTNPYKVKYIGNYNKDFGNNTVLVKGKDGVTTKTTSYIVDENGNVTSNIKEDVIDSINEEVEVGLKIKVEIITEDGKKIERTTEYELDENTGKVTPKVSDKILDSIIPPVLDVPEYTGSISTNTPVDDNGDLILPPVVEKPEFNGSVNPIDPPVVEITEYNGGVVPLDPSVVEIQEFNDGVTPIEPPVVEIPEYNGDLTPPKPPVVEITKEEPAKPTENKPVEPKQEKVLPNTNSTSVLASLVSSVIGTLGLGYKSKRKK